MAKQTDIFWLRSRPLVIDPETGEPAESDPRNYSLTYGAPWRLVIRTETLRRKSRDYESYADAKRALAKLRHLHGDWEMTIVSKRIAYGPPWAKVSDKRLWHENAAGNLWCPYCRTFREFLYDPRWEVKRCPICGAMDDTVEVQRNNRPWAGGE